MSPRRRVRFAAGLCLLVFALWNAGDLAARPAQNAICPVHGVEMKAVQLKLIYGMPSQQEFEEMKAAKTKFPFGRDCVLAGCVVKPEKTVAGFLCAGCVAERDKWLRERRRVSR
ncbi:MAG: hypothetical protein FGM15_11415 [Chthoniobacterales bacterium]|nr:hypothetical protein [Chthoniobacterales bacterium]